MPDPCEGPNKDWLHLVVALFFGVVVLNTNPSNADISDGNIDRNMSIEDFRKELEEIINGDDTFSKLRRLRERLVSVELPKFQRELSQTKEKLEASKRKILVTEDALRELDTEGLEEQNNDLKRRLEFVKKRKLQTETRLKELKARNRNITAKNESFDISDVEQQIRDLGEEELFFTREVSSINRKIKLEVEKNRSLGANLVVLSKSIEELETEDKISKGLLRKFDNFLFETELRINEILIPVRQESNFKEKIAITFASLVGAVIVGFFAVALYDHRVRRAIFSGDAGIQFITLFSLVIAIILFGITGILGAKELAALLGGISGYILGRSSNSDEVVRKIRTVFQTPDDINGDTQTERG